jgi:hypothetical protein
MAGGSTVSSVTNQSENYQTFWSGFAKQIVTQYSAKIPQKIEKTTYFDHQ